MIELSVTKNFKHERMHFAFKANSNRIVVFGPSGCGKSTLIKLIAGFFQPNSGEIFVNGACVYSTPKGKNIPVHKRNFGYLSQENTLFPNMTVRENILYGLKASGMPLDKGDFGNITKRLKIDHKLDSYPGALSGGQIQRAALARVLLIHPKLLLLDEPFSGLDIPIRECLRELVVELVDELKIPLIFVTHDAEDAYIVGKEMVVIDDGKVIEFGSMDKVYHNPEFVETARLLDFKNIWLIQSVEGNNVVLSEGVVLSVKAEQSLEDYNFVCVRPNDVRIVQDFDAEKCENLFRGIVKETHHRGSHIKFLVQTDVGFLLHVCCSRYEHEGSNLKVSDQIGAILAPNYLALCK